MGEARPGESDMSIRSFVALPIPEEVARHLARLHESVPRTAGRIKWIKADAMHLTCVFLGDIEQDQVNPIADALGEAVEGVDSYVTCLDGVGAFPNFNRPRIVWVGLDSGAEETRSLKIRIDAALQSLGFAPEKRAFHPHLTLGRVREPGQRGILEKAAAEWVLPYENWMSNELIFFQSVLDRHGPTYSPLARIPLVRAGSSVGPV